MLKNVSISGSIIWKYKCICNFTMLMHEHIPLASCLFPLLYSPYFLIFSFIWLYKVKERECSKDTFILSST